MVGSGRGAGCQDGIGLVGELLLVELWRAGEVEGADEEQGCGRTLRSDHELPMEPAGPTSEVPSQFLCCSLHYPQHCSCYCCSQCCYHWRAFVRMLPTLLAECREGELLDLMVA